MRRCKKTAALVVWHDGRVQQSSATNTWREKAETAATMGCQAASSDCSTDLGTGQSLTGQLHSNVHRLLPSLLADSASARFVPRIDWKTIILARTAVRGAFLYPVKRIAPQSNALADPVPSGTTFMLLGTGLRLQNSQVHAYALSNTVPYHTKRLACPCVSTARNAPQRRKSGRLVPYAGQHADCTLFSVSSWPRRPAASSLLHTTVSSCIRQGAPASAVHLAWPCRLGALKPY